MPDFPPLKEVFPKRDAGPRHVKFVILESLLHRYENSQLTAFDFLALVVSCIQTHSRDESRGVSPQSDPTWGGRDAQLDQG